MSRRYLIRYVPRCGFELVLDDSERRFHFYWCGVVADDGYWAESVAPMVFWPDVFSVIAFARKKGFSPLFLADWEGSIGKGNWIYHEIKAATSPAAESSK